MKTTITLKEKINYVGKLGEEVCQKFGRTFAKKITRNTLL